MSDSSTFGSFRDPSGYVCDSGEGIERHITEFGRANYELLMSSGLYESLTKQKLLVSHTEKKTLVPNSYKIIAPQLIPIITYPYEWSFSQLKDAALLTLQIETIALEKGMSLKDATPFNVQFFECKPIFIDTLSFEQFDQKIWVAYRQFCELFLAPLLLMSKIKVDFNKYLREDIHGIDLSMCAKIMGVRGLLNPGVFQHIYLHAFGQKSINAEKGRGDGLVGAASGFKMSKFQRLAMIDSLRSLVTSLKPLKDKSAFSDYYLECTHYSADDESKKIQWVQKKAVDAGISRVLDLGGNDGKYSRFFSKNGTPVICMDSNASVVDSNYLQAKKQADPNMLPLVMDLSNPTPSLGWMCQERQSFFKRFKSNAVLCLALIHHLRVSCNVPFKQMAEFFNECAAKHLYIEYVPKADEKTQGLLCFRKDIFLDYSQENFETCFLNYFNLIEKTVLKDGGRVLYHFCKRENVCSE